MDIFKNFKFIKTDRLESLEKGEEDLKVIRNILRPEDENNFFNFNRSMSWGMYDSQVTPFDLYQLSVYSDILQNVFNTLKNEMFRNGFNYKASGIIQNKLQLEKIERIINKANFNNQTLIEIFKEFENDLNVIDNGFLLARKNYFLNANNKIIGGEVVELLRLDPLSVEKLMDSTNRLGYNSDGRPVYFDPQARGELVEDEYNKEGIKNFRACFKVRSGKSKYSDKSGYQYYDTSEVLHVSKYRPSKAYGFSPLYSLYNKVMTLINMDYYIKQYYSGNKVPKGILTVNTSNASGFWNFWDTFIEKVRKNPHAVHPLIHPSGEGKDPIKWIDFMRNLQEMQYTDVRNEIRTQIGAVYNVAPIFQNDVSTGGGLNNEGLQITVTNRGVEMGQDIYNNKVLPWIITQLGGSDYTWMLNSSEEEDEVAERDLRLKEIEIARKTAELGIDVTMNENGEFSYSAGKVELQTEDQSFAPFFETAKSCKIEKKDNPEKQMESALMNELEKLLSKFDTKTRPTKAELDKKIKETVKDFDKAVKTKSSRKLKAIYQKAAEDLGKDIGQDFVMSTEDKNVIEALKKQPKTQKAFANMSNNLSDKLREVVQDAYSRKDFSIEKVMEELRETVNETESSLTRIARTESSKVAIAARKTQYDKTGVEYKYFHIGPNDNRTAEVSKAVVNKTKNGVTWKEYVDIMRKESKKLNPKWTINPDFPITHPNTRHTFIAKRVK